MKKEKILDCPFCGTKRVRHDIYPLIEELNINLQELFSVCDIISRNAQALSDRNDFNIQEEKERACHPKIAEIGNELLFISICGFCNHKRILSFEHKICGTFVGKQNLPSRGPRTIYPILPDGEPLPDCMPEDLRKDFDEARLLVNYSVRCAVGLLRICGEKLCNFIADKYITDENIKKEIKEKQKELKPKIDLLVRHRQNYFSFIGKEYIKQLEVVKDTGNRNLHANLILDEYTRDDFKTLCTIITAICNTIATKEENDKSINALKEKNDINDPKKR